MAGAPNDENQQPQQPMEYVQDIQPEPKVRIPQELILVTSKPYHSLFDVIRLTRQNTR